jgi:LysR family cyn operon transcriptional activator
MVLDARPLRNFVAVAELGSITLAGRKLFLSQPSLSRQIKSLEQQVGTTLFKRTRGSKQVQLTHAGEVLLQHARILLTELDHAQAQLEEAKTEHGGLIRIAAAPAALSYVVMPAVASFRELSPRCTIELVESDWNSELVHVQRGTADLAVGHAVAGLRDVQFDPLYSARLYAVLAPSHQLANNTTITAEELMQEDLLLFRGAPSAQLAHESFLHLTGLTPRSVFESQLPQTLLRAAELGRGIALLTDIVPFEGYNLKAVPVVQNDRHFESVRVLAWHQRQPMRDVTKRFIEVLKEQAKQSRSDSYPVE